MTYPPPGGYQPDPYGQQYPQAPFGGQPADPYAPQPADPYAAPPPGGYGQDPYISPPGGGYGQQPADPYSQPSWPGQSPPQSAPPGFGPPPPGGPGGFLPPGPPEPQKKSPVGWIIGGVLAVLLIIGAVGGAILWLPGGESDDAAGGSSESSESSDSGDDSTTEESTQPSGTPTDTVNAYYSSLTSHDMDGVIDTMCAREAEAAQGDPFRPMTEEEFWEIVDNSVYTVGTETQIDDENAEVDVDHTYEAGGQSASETLTAELILEDNEWKICDWQT